MVAPGQAGARACQGVFSLREGVLRSWPADSQWRGLSPDTGQQPPWQHADGRCRHGRQAQGPVSFQVRSTDWKRGSRPVLLCDLHRGGGERWLRGRRPVAAIGIWVWFSSKRCAWARCGDQRNPSLQDGSNKPKPRRPETATGSLSRFEPGGMREWRAWIPPIPPGAPGGLRGSMGNGSAQPLLPRSHAMANREATRLGGKGSELFPRSPLLRFSAAAPQPLPLRSVTSACGTGAAFRAAPARPGLPERGWDVGQAPPSRAQKKGPSGPLAASWAEVVSPCGRVGRADRHRSRSRP